LFFTFLVFRVSYAGIHRADLGTFIRINYIGCISL
jgi:hypothetical protein